jgi:hypothetical protein
MTSGRRATSWTPASKLVFRNRVGNITYGRSQAGEITSVSNNTYTLSGASGSTISGELDSDYLARIEVVHLCDIVCFP